MAHVGPRTIPPVRRTAPAAVPVGRPVSTDKDVVDFGDDVHSDLLRRFAQTSPQVLQTVLEGKGDHHRETLSDDGIRTITALEARVDAERAKASQSLSLSHHERKHLMINTFAWWPLGISTGILLGTLGGIAFETVGGALSGVLGGLATTMVGRVVDRGVSSLISERIDKAAGEIIGMIVGLMTCGIAFLGAGYSLLLGFLDITALGSALTILTSMAILAGEPLTEAVSRRLSTRANARKALERHQELLAHCQSTVGTVAGITDIFKGRPDLAIAYLEGTFTEHFSGLKDETEAEIRRINASLAQTERDLKSDSLEVMDDDDKTLLVGQLEDKKARLQEELGESEQHLANLNKLINENTPAQIEAIKALREQIQAHRQDLNRTAEMHRKNLEIAERANATDEQIRKIQEAREEQVRQAVAAIETAEAAVAAAMLGATAILEVDQVELLASQGP